MGSATEEINTKIAETQSELDVTLNEREAIERSIRDAERALDEQGQALQAVLVSCNRNK